MDNIVQIRPYDPKDWEELKNNAAEDNHGGIYYPSVVSIKDGKIVGYLSIAQVPMVLCWQHSQKVGPLDSVRLLGYVEGALSQYKHFCFPCDPESPYNRLLPKAGYSEYTRLVKLYIKE